MIYVFDACALIAYLKGEPGEDSISDLLEQAEAGEIAIYMHIINLFEVYYGFYKDLGETRAKAILEKIYNLPITVIDRVTRQVFDKAAGYKALYKCSLADTIGLATAAELSGQFVTSDHHELEEIEKREGIPIFWLAPRRQN